MSQQNQGNTFITGTELHKTYKNPEAEPPKKTRILPETDLDGNKEKEEDERRERAWKEIRKRVKIFFILYVKNEIFFTNL